MNYPDLARHENQVDGYPRLAFGSIHLDYVLKDAVTRELGILYRYGESHEAVIRRLLATIRRIAPYIYREDDRDALAAEAHRALTASARWTDEASRREIEDDLRRVFSAFPASGAISRSSPS